MFKISEFSKLTNISPRMLRHYDKLNLLKPKIIQTDNNYRYYTPEQITQVNQILSLKNIGIPLKEIKTFLDGDVDLADYLAKHRTLLETELAEKKLQLAYLALLEEKNTTSKTEAVNYPIETKIMNDLFVLTYHQKVASYYEEEQLWQQLFSTIRTEDQAKLGHSIAVFHNTASDSLDIEVMISIPESLKPLYPQTKTFSPGLIASVVTNGAYNAIPTIHADMADWLEVNEYVITGSTFNIYHSSPATEEQEEFYITEICYPIKSK
ncbi:MerR family transcriptional regulator [Enterococcus crotali]